MSLDNAAENCDLPAYPGSSQWPAAINYMDSLAAVVACGGVNVADSSTCWAFDGSSWTPLPDSTEHHCFYNSQSMVVDQGWWVAGTLQIGNGGFGGCSIEFDDWTSEIFTGADWIPGPQHPTGSSAVYPCLAKAGVYIVPYNFIFFHTSSFFYPDFLSKISIPFLSVTLDTPPNRLIAIYSKDDFASPFPFFHIIFFPTAMIFPSPFTT